MNNDPDFLLSHIYRDIRGKPLDWQQKYHPRFTNDLEFVEAWPHCDPLPNCNHRRVVGLVEDIAAYRPEFIASLRPVDYILTQNLGSELRFGHSSEFIPYHIIATARANSSVSIAHRSCRPYLFDCLLGGSSPSRERLVDQFYKHNLVSSSLVNIGKAPAWPNGRVYRSPALDSLDNQTVAQLIKDGFLNSTNTVPMIVTDELGTFTANIWASRIVPSTVYENSWISIVAETAPDGIFPTEKIAKPIIGGRVFLVVAGQGYLQQLRSLGFKTFSSVVDETYDTLQCLNDRIDAVAEEAARLSKMDMCKIYQKLSSVLEHNKQLVLTEKILDPVKHYLETLPECLGFSA